MRVSDLRVRFAQMVSSGAHRPAAWDWDLAKATAADVGTGWIMGR